MQITVKRTGISTRSLRINAGSILKEELQKSGQELVGLAQTRAERVVRAHRSASAGPSYNDSFKSRVQGSRLNWDLIFWNDARDAEIQERGRRAHRRGFNPTDEGGQNVRLWITDRGLTGQFREQDQRRGVKGRFLKKRVYTADQILFLVNRSVKRKGRKATHVMEFTVQQYLNRANNPRTRIGRRLRAALR